jgi:hypothetical protein
MQVTLYSSVYVQPSLSSCRLSPGLVIAVLYGMNVDKLAGSRDVIGATIALFVLHGSAAAGFTYCLTYLFKSPASAQNVMIFINVGDSY